MGPFKSICQDYAEKHLSGIVTLQCKNDSLFFESLIRLVTVMSLLVQTMFPQKVSTSFVLLRSGLLFCLTLLRRLKKQGSFPFLA